MTKVVAQEGAMLDKMSRKLLAELQADGRISNVEPR